jgi:tape measure domain-containing protein
MATQTITVELVDRVSRSLGTIEQRLGNLDRSAGKINGSFGLAGKAAGAFVGALAVEKVIQFGQAVLNSAAKFQNYENQLRLITGSQAELQNTMSQLTILAKENRSAFGDTVDLFTKLTLSTDEMGISQERVLAVTAKFQKALAISGADANTASGAIRQFGQAMASGTVRGDEFNSIVEALGPALSIMAKQSGVGVGQLRELSQAGELTAERFFEMVEGATALDAAFGQTEPTIDNLETALGDAFDRALNAVAEATGAAKIYEKVLIDLAATADRIAGTEGPLAKLGSADLFDGVVAGTIDVNAALTEMESKLTKLEREAAKLDEDGLFFGVFPEELQAAAQELTKYTILLKAHRVDLQGIAEDAEVAAEAEAERTATLNAQADALKAVLAPHQRFIDQAKESAKSDYRTELEKANQRLIDAEIVLEQLMTAHERTNGQVENFVFLLKATQTEISLAEQGILDLKTATETLGETSAFDKYYNNLISGANAAAQENMFAVQAQTRLKEQLDAGKISLDTYANAMTKYMEATKASTPATDELGDAIDALRSKYESFIYTSGQIAQNEYLADLDTFKQALDAKKISLDEHNSFVKAAETKLQDALSSIREKELQEEQKRLQERQQMYTNNLSLFKQGKFDEVDVTKMSEDQKKKFAVESARDALSQVAQHNKTAFRANKALLIAEAIMNTYTGATKALASFPPPFNFIAAAAVVGAGFANVAAIRSQQYTGRQRGGALQIGRGTVVGEDGPEIIVPKQPSTVIPREVAQAIDGLGGGRGGENVIVNFNIQTVDAEDFDTLLVKRRGTIVGIINQAMQKRGKQGVTS